jgi:hypothetical protein
MSTMSSVEFSSAVATFTEQMGGWAPSKMIDGDFTGDQGNGWAVVDTATGVVPQLVVSKFTEAVKPVQVTATPLRQPAAAGRPPSRLPRATFRARSLAVLRTVFESSRAL